MINEIRAIFDSINFYDSCPDCKGRCCYLPWVLEEECSLVHEFRDAVEAIGPINFFLDKRKCKFLDENEKCKIYGIRPLDCRLFPLDIIEENGTYYWCVFTICPGWQEMRDLLRPVMAEIEGRISQNMWEQFKKQIVITKEIYEPYKRRQYCIISEFTKFL